MPSPSTMRTKNDTVRPTMKLKKVLEFRPIFLARLALMLLEVTTVVPASIPDNIYKKSIIPPKTYPSKIFLIRQS